MKLKRMVATMLALLLVASLLPIGAMATDNADNNATISTPIDTNTGDNVTVTENGSIQTNEGQVKKNEGTVKTNERTVVTNSKDVHVNKGTVGTNEGQVTENHGTVVTNNGSVDTNEGTVGTNIGSVNTNEGTIGTNNGKVDKNHGTIETNNKEVDTNGKGKIITTNNSNGSVSTNDGTVKTNDGTVVLNDGTVETNNGTVGQQKDNGEIVALKGNRGNIDTNNGTVLGNREKATIGTNNGTVKENYGTVETNGIDGVVDNYNTGGVVAASNDDAIETPTEQPPAVAGIGTNFGTVHNADNKTYYGLSWGDSVDKLNSIESFVQDGTTLNLNAEAAKATRSGYKMTGFTAFARRNGADAQITGDTANYRMDAPVWLQILWEKLGKSAQPTRTPVYTKLSAEQVKVGTFVRCGNMTFKIIEVTDDSIRVATVGKLSDAALADMLGFLKQHLSDAQIAKLIGAPELLEQELVSKFFGGSNEHIAFYASPDLFA